MRNITFTYGGGRKMVHGRSVYPDSLMVTMSRQRAWDLAQSLLHQIRYPTPEPEVTFWALGELTTDGE
jgi:hypothetical protein